MLLHIVAVLVLLVCARAVPFPLQSTVDTATANIAAAQIPTPTGLTKEDYLQTVAGITGYERTYLQSSTGIIVDPYANREVQYATPTFAHAAIVQGLVTHDDATLNAGVSSSVATLSFVASRMERRTGTSPQHASFLGVVAW